MNGSTKFPVFFFTKPLTSCHHWAVAGVVTKAFIFSFWDKGKRIMTPMPPSINLSPTFTLHEVQNEQCGEATWDKTRLKQQCWNNDFPNSSRKIPTLVLMILRVLSLCQHEKWAGLLRNAPCFKFDSFHWQLQEEKWFLQRFQADQLIWELPNTQSVGYNLPEPLTHKIKDLWRETHAARRAGGGFCIHKRPWTRFSLQLTFTLTLQPSTLVALFTSHYFCHCFAGVLWWFMAIFQLQFCGFLLSSVFVGIAQRESCLCTLVWCWCQPGFFPLCPVFTVF